jgi:glucokinase
MPEGFTQRTGVVMGKMVVGIDVGGTNIKFGIVDPSGKIVARLSIATKTYLSDKKVLIAAIVGHTQQMLADHGLDKSHIKGVGIGLPGLVDPCKGIVKFLPNIPGWKNVPLKDILRQQMGFSIHLENDVNMITLGEWRFGAGKGCANLLCMTLGTGVGGGLVLNNALYRGEGFAAGEVGHIPINEDGPQCNCGGWACFERYVGNSHLQQKAAGIFRNPQITLEEVTALAKNGDRQALLFWEDVAGRIGKALIGVVNLLNPRRIIIGGGVTNCPYDLFRVVQRTIKERAMGVQSGMVKVVKARLGNMAGIMGAQVLVDERC